MPGRGLLLLDEPGGVQVLSPLRRTPRVAHAQGGDPERLVCEACGFVFYLGPKLVAGAIVERTGG